LKPSYRAQAASVAVKREDTMFVKLAFAGAVITVTALLAPALSIGSRHADATCFGSVATITGSGTIVGTDGNDVIVGSDGNDVIQGKGGDDKICGGAGDDRLGGGPGNDQLDGGAGNDDLNGGLGDDVLLGGEGDDSFECGLGNDTVDGGPGTNTAVTTGDEACETLANANPPATPPGAKTFALRALLTVGQVAPHPKGTRGATGRFAATLTVTASGASVAWRLTFGRLTGPARAAHIHVGRPGQAGGAIIVTLCAPCSSGAHGTVDVNGQPARMAILSGGSYVDVHTQKNPAGEIRGPIPRASTGGQ
jgi:hypothetical protein